MTGLGRALLVQGFNSLITLFVILLIISTMFVYLSQRQLEAMVMEAVQLYALNLARNPALTPEEREQLLTRFEQNLKIRFGLVGSPVERVFNLMARLVTLDLGNARAAYVGPSTLIKDQILYALKNTIILFTTATIIAAALGIALGLVSARMIGSPIDRLVSFLAIVSSSVPFWWFGMLVLLLFAFKLKLFPFSSKDVYVVLSILRMKLEAGEIGYAYYALRGLYEWVRHMALPMFTVAFISLGSWAYVTRNVVVNKLTEDFVVTARAKGLPERTVMYKHVLRASSPPIVTLIALGLVNSLGGAIITETVFGWPGMGLLYWTAISAGEPMLLAANVYVTILLFVIVVFVLNFIYAFLDPRIKTGAVTPGVM